MTAPNDDRPRGHLKLARKLFHPESGDADWLEERVFSRFEAWVDVLQMAAWAPRRQGDAMLARGEFVASLRTLSKRWKWTIKKVRVWLAEAQKSGKIRGTDTPEKGHIQGHALGHTKGHRAGTVYLIVNYDRYQSGNPEMGTGAGTGQGTPKGTPPHEKGHKKESSKAITTKTHGEYDAIFVEAWAAYPKRAGNSKADTYRQWLSRVREGIDPLAMLEGARAYARFIEANPPEDPKYVKQAQTFFGRGMHFESDWTPGETADPRVQRILQIVEEEDAALQRTRDLLASRGAA